MKKVLHISEKFPALAQWFRKGLRFGVTALSALLLHVIINGGGVELLHLSPRVTYPFSLLVITLTNFLLFRFYVYEAAREKDGYLQGGQFLIATIIFRILEWGLFTLLHTGFGLWYAYAVISVQIIGTLTKFIFYNYFIFGTNFFFCRKIKHETGDDL